MALALAADDLQPAADAAAPSAAVTKPPLPVWVSAQLSSRGHSWPYRHQAQ
eukprot:CAMPEP_0117573150 /NCGR_PEP_ID=MMETSP0784-20121206/60787_1 /TAXON_ID=39447 /ORGANISM="" /LENGTH=50 /DNA_ID=CAMNT_0005371669 /DNA_START=55 /DNA_END=203 /DNA_ORIENTATION=-